MFADALVPKRHKANSNHHTYLLNCLRITNVYYTTYISYYSHNKGCLKEFGMYTAYWFSFLQADLSSYKDIDYHVICQPFTNQHKISRSATVVMIENKNIFIIV